MPKRPRLFSPQFRVFIRIANKLEIGTPICCMFETYPIVGHSLSRPRPLAVILGRCRVFGIQSVSYGIGLSMC